MHDSTHTAETIQNTICLMILQVTEPLTFGSLKQVSQGSFPANQSPKLNPTIRHSSCNSSFILVLSNKINQTSPNPSISRSLKGGRVLQRLL